MRVRPPGFFASSPMFVLKAERAEAVAHRIVGMRGPHGSNFLESSAPMAMLAGRRRAWALA